MAALDICIIGAGIGGPVAAILLARNGHKVTIYERASSAGDVGYAFRITPNSDRCLKYLDIDVEAGGAVSANVSRMFDASGKLMYEIRENMGSDQDQKKGTSVFAYRPQLHQQLFDAAKQSGVRIILGVKVVSVKPETTEITLEDGTTVVADMIIGADGVNSLVRLQVTGAEDFEPRASSGHNAFRFMLDKSTLLQDQIMSTMVSDDSRMFSWSGNDKRILVYPVDHDKQFNVTLTHHEELSDKEVAKNGSDSSESTAYNQKVSQETVLAIYSDMPPEVSQLIKLADPKGFRVWKLQDMDDISTWSLNNTVLIGDSCHPILPFGFSGASMAIEDAVTVATLLPKGVSKDEIPTRMKIYENLRRPRVNRVRDTSRYIATGAEDRETVQQYRAFLFEHDAVEVAKDALRRHLKETAMQK